MPKQTFLHLSKDKQDNLLHAAKLEFSRVPLHEASIANIVKSACIPRGSFYQYFEDKEDLYFYMLHQFSKKNMEHFMQVLAEKDGDLFETFIESFQFIMKNSRTQEHKNFFKHVFLNMNYKLENTLANHIYEESQKSQYVHMISQINRDSLNIRDEKELHQIFKIIMAVTFQNQVQMFVKEMTEDDVLHNYCQQIELLKRGFHKELEECP